MNDRNEHCRTGHRKAASLSRKASCLALAFLLLAALGTSPCRAAGVAAPALTDALKTERIYQEAVAKVVPSYVMIGGGSGVVITPDGLMLTNHHVIAQGYDRGRKTDLSVRVGAKFFKADILGTDPRGDIALLQIKNAKDLPAIPFADSDELIVGQQVIAIGNPFGTMEVLGDPTVTLGVISCLHRFVDTYSDAIQTDTPINPGNSGGPLLTMDGKLAGINGRINTKHGARANTGIGLAIPANQIKRFLPLLKEAKSGLAHHAELAGLEGDETEADGIQNGAEVKTVKPDSPAEALGFKPGDRITHIEQMPIRNFNRFLGVLGTYPAGSEVTIHFVRDNKTQNVKAKLERFDRGYLGFRVVGQVLSREGFQLLQQLRKDRNAKIPPKVEAVDKGSQAEKAGLQKGDAILEVNGQAMNNLISFREVLQKLDQDGKFKPGETLKLKIRRGSEEKTISVPLSSQVEAYERKAAEKNNEKDPGKKK